MVYPRVGGETVTANIAEDRSIPAWAGLRSTANIAQQGLSPRGRGNPCAQQP